MLDYIDSLCQTKKILGDRFGMSFFFKLVMLVFFTSCASEPPPNKKILPTVGWATVQGEPFWFKSRERFYPQSSVIIHPFYDLSPLIDYKENTINFFVVNPAGSVVMQDFDLLSGRFFKKYDLCDMKDVWDNQRTILSAFPYTEGRVPRVLDQLGRPLKIYVFGREQFYSLGHEDASHTARVVGGIKEEYCDVPPCDAGRGWISRTILIGVDAEDERFHNVKNLAQLKKQIIWKDALAFMQNGYGIELSLVHSYPAYRMSYEIPPQRALQMLTTNRRVMQKNELERIRRSCFRLFDFYWEAVGKWYDDKGSWEELRKKERINRTPNWPKKNWKDQKFSQYKESFLITDLNETKEKTLQRRFMGLHEKYGKHFQTCVNFVQPTNILYDFNRHWFFAYISAFYKLQQLGYSYNCNLFDWEKEKKWSAGTWNMGYIQSLKDCPSVKLDKIISSAVSYLGKLRSLGHRHFRYIEYDYTPKGSHHRLHSWVEDESKFLDCRDSSLTYFFTKKEQHFPKDVSWKNLFLEEEEESSLIERAGKRGE